MKSLAVFSLALATLSGPVYSTPEENTPLLSREFTFEILRHLYRWYLDEAFLREDDSIREATEIGFWMRELDPASDPDDKSIYLELLLPALKGVIHLKKANYLVPELGAEVKNKDFRIAMIERYRDLPAPKSAYQIVTYTRAEILAYLYETRNQREYPDERVRASLGEALDRRMKEAGPVEIEGDQIFFLAPLSPVTNDLWVFWENQRRIIRFTSDADYDTEFYWQHAETGVDVYDLDNDIIISLLERPGSNAYITKDSVGRVLFNCIVLGMKIVAPEAEVKAKWGK